MESLVAEQSFEAALAEVERLRPLLRALEDLGAEPAVDLQALESSVRAQASEALVEQAREALDQGAPGLALGHLQRAGGLHPDRPDLTRLQKEVWLAWAEEAADGREAATRLARAAELGSEEARVRAVQLWTEEARRARSRGACRRATQDLEAALRLQPDKELRAELVEARRCAETWLSLEIDERPVRSACPKLGVAAQLERQLEELGSPFLHVAGPGETPRSRRVPGPEGGLEQGPAVLALTVSRCSTLPGVVSAQARTRRADGPQGASYVTWVEHTQPVFVELDAQLRLAIGERLLLQRKLAVRGAAEAVWSEGGREEARRRAVEQARAGALAGLVREAGAIVLATIDAE